MVFLNLLAACSSTSEQTLSELMIVHTNDIEGEVDPCSCAVSPAGGAARRATAVLELRKDHPDLLLVDSGDALFGTPVSDATGGQVQIAVMNAMRYDGAALGDRDFRYGLGPLQEAVRMAKFQFLSANVLWADSDEPLVSPGVIVNKGGVRIALIGLTSPTAQQVFDADPEMRQKLKIIDPIQAAKKAVASFRKEADAVVILSHLGKDLDRKLAESVPGITAIIGGHSRHLISPPEILARSVPLVQVGYDGDPLGVLQLTIDGRGHPQEAKSDNLRLDGDYPGDPGVSHLVATYKAQAVLSASLPLETGLVPETPLDVRKADAEVQKAYLIALGFPQLLAEHPFPAGGGAASGTNLLSCFSNTASDPEMELKYSLTALNEPECISAAENLQADLPLFVQHPPVLPEYRVEPGDMQ